MTISILRRAPHLAAACLTALSLAAPLAGQTATGDTATEPPDGALIVLDFKGGFRVAPQPGEVEKPTMIVQRNGKVIVNRNDGYVDQLTRDELQSLVQFVVREKKFFEFDERAVKQRVEKATKEREKAGEFLPRIADLPTLHVTVDYAGRKAEKQYYAIDLDAGAFKDIQELQNFLAIKNRLLEVMQRAVKRNEQAPQR